MTTTWTIDPTHTEVGFAVKHLMISTVKGRFQDVTGQVRMVDNDPLSAEIEVEIGVASVNTGTPDRDAHLRSPDFFEVDRFPKMSYRSRKVEQISEDEFRMVGDLRLRDQTREVPLTVTREGQIKDPYGNNRLGLSATGKLRRSDFGMTFNAALETGGVIVGDEVRLNFDLELVQAAEARVAA